mmetsp:Transcript_4763/g.8396  ORF Transcript_4763/g.8396 Transcript_4763/m.8396 type:complete len:125 (+) Transcript_4763:208-582(+)
MMSKGRGSKLTLSRGRGNPALDKAREILGVSKGEFETELEAYRPMVRPLLNLERPGLGAEQLKRDKEKKDLLPTEAKLMRSINNKRLKRSRDRRELLRESMEEESSDEEELVSKASSFTKKAKK